MAKSEAKTVGIVDTEEALTAKIAEVRAAQAIFAISVWGVVSLPSARDSCC